MKSSAWAFWSGRAALRVQSTARPAWCPLDPVPEHGRVMFTYCADPYVPLISPRTATGPGFSVGSQVFSAS